MGYFSRADLDMKEGKKILSFDVRIKMIAIIKRAFPTKTYENIESLTDDSLRGLYAQAMKKLKTKTIENEIIDDFAIPDEEEKRSFK